MGFFDSISVAGVVCALLATFCVANGLRCLSCQGQNVYECIMSAVVVICSKGEECRFRMLFRRHLPSRTMAWFEAGCASVPECRAPDSEYYAHFCCRFPFCNFLSSGR